MAIKETAPAETVEATVVSVTYPARWFGTVSRCGFTASRDPKKKTADMAAKGICCEVSPRSHVRLTGHWEDSGHFAFKSLEVLVSDDDDRSGLLSKVFGPKTSLSVMERVGSYDKITEALEKNDISAFAGVPGFGEAKFADARQKWLRFEYVSRANSKLGKLGMTASEISRAVDAFGADTTEKVCGNPYVLCASDVVDFFRADAIGRNAGIGSKDPRRIASAVKAALTSAFPDVCVPRWRLLSRVSRDFLIPGEAEGTETASKEEISGMLERMLAAKITVSCVKDGEEYIFLAEQWRQKEVIRSFVEQNSGMRSVLSGSEADIDEYERKKGFRLGREQREAVLRSIRSRVSIITGGPGTGKTTVLDCLMSIIGKQISPGEVCLCSPTGKAAVRMQESTGHPASTIHSALQVDPSDRTLTTFMYNEKNKLPYRVIIVDESSMIDYFVGSSLLAAVKPAAMVVFVGDKNQLNPVGAGYFFRDLLKCGVPTSTLTETYRQAGDSSVIVFAKMIQNGTVSRRLIEMRSAMCEQFGKRDFAFVMLPKAASEQCSAITNIYYESLRDLVSKETEGDAEEKRRNAIRETIILSPENGTEAGVDAINRSIASALFPHPDKGSCLVRNCQRFIAGERVMITRNCRQLGTVNGQLGFIREINFIARTVVIDFDDGRSVAYDSEHLKEISLGYCITVHKSQGSEWRRVIQVVSPEHRNNCQPLIYTGLTRAREDFVVVGSRRDFSEFAVRKGRQVISFIR